MKNSFGLRGLTGYVERLCGAFHPAFCVAALVGSRPGLWQIDNGPETTGRYDQPHE